MMNFSEALLAIEHSFNEEILKDHSHDQTEDLHFLPQIVFKPKTTEEVSQIVKFCNENKIPITP
jgi:glycolate oxidase